MEMVHCWFDAFEPSSWIHPVALVASLLSWTSQARMNVDGVSRMAGEHLIADSAIRFGSHHLAPNHTLTRGYWVSYCG